MSVVSSAETQRLEADGYRQQIMLRLTSWVQDITGVVPDPEATDSASLERALNEVNGVVHEIGLETGREPLGLEAEQLLVAAELVMRRAAEYARRGETYEETQWVRAALTVVETAGQEFAEAAKECAECGEVHQTAGTLCVSCRARRRRKALDSGGARWTLGYEGAGDPDAAAWTLRHGVEGDTVVLAVETSLGPDDWERAQVWGVEALKRDHGVAVIDWAPVRARPWFTETSYWVAATDTE